MDDAEIARLRTRMKLQPVTPNTITRWDQLLGEIAEIRQRGYAFDREENSLGICAVAVALRNPAGEIASISIPAPAQRFATTRDDLTQALVRHVSRLQDTLSR